MYPYYRILTFTAVVFNRVKRSGFVLFLVFEEGFQLLYKYLRTKRRKDSLMSGIYDILPYGPMYFDEDTVTDETEREIAAEFIREKCLRNLDKEIPHGIAVVIDKMRERPDGSLVDIEATIICEKESHKGIIIGKKGAMLKKIGIQSRKSIEEMLGIQVNLRLWVKVRPDWRNKTSYMSEYGYKK